MRRWLTVLGILGAVTAGIVVMAVGFPHTWKDPAPIDASVAPVISGGRQANAAQRTQPPSTSQPIVRKMDLPGVAGPLVIPGCRLLVKDRQAVPALRDGQIQFIATEPEPGETVPPERAVDIEMRYVVVPIKDDETVDKHDIIKIPGVNKDYRRAKDGEHLDPKDTLIIAQEKRLKRLIVGDKVKKGQLLALVDPRLALDDLGIKTARILSATAEREAAEKTKDEANSRHINYRNLMFKGAMSREEVDGAQLTYERYKYEEVSKRQAIILAGHEMKQSQTIVEMHSIRSKIDGEIKAIFKNRGDAVRNLDDLFLIQDPYRLRVEGLVDLQYDQDIQTGMKVTVEPSKLEKPRHVLRGHLQEVVSVAVTAGDRPLILSGSEDRTVRVWDSAEGRQLYNIEFASAVKAVACSQDGKQNLAVAGTADGTAWLLRAFDMNKGPTPQALAGRHKGPVNCAAFSPDGKLVATGGEDHMIRLFDTSNGELLHLCPPDQGHRGAVTSLHFASNTELVSSGRGDQSVMVWKLGAGGAPTRSAEYPRRSGDVDNLGVSPDGKQLLFDQGKDLQVLSLASGQIEGVLHNSSPSMNFTTMALFSPGEGKLILTASGADNRLQLYRNPVGNRRGAEIRQLMWQGAPAKCGAFAPSGRFLVTGMRDRNVLVWLMPKPEEVDRKLEATIITKDRSLDSSARQMRITAELPNEDGYLVPGDTATIVIDMKK